MRRVVLESSGQPSSQSSSLPLVSPHRLLEESGGAEEAEEHRAGLPAQHSVALSRHQPPQLGEGTAPLHALVQPRLKGALSSQPNPQSSQDEVGVKALCAMQVVVQCRGNSGCL